MGRGVGRRGAGGGRIERGEEGREGGGEIDGGCREWGAGCKATSVQKKRIAGRGATADREADPRKK
jgi:hypothetical protein